MIEARIEYDFPRDGHKVWIFERLGDTMRVYYPGPYSLRGVTAHTTVRAENPWRTVEPNVEPDPTFTLPQGGLEALLTAAGHLVRETDATIEALADARQHRDRLLSLVEAAWRQHITPDSP